MHILQEEGLSQHMLTENQLTSSMLPSSTPTYISVISSGLSSLSNDAPPSYVPRNVFLDIRTVRHDSGAGGGAGEGGSNSNGDTFEGSVGGGSSDSYVEILEDGTRKTLVSSPLHRHHLQQ